MKSLGEIKRNIISFYTMIQSRITDFSVSSVVNGLFYAFSSALESAYRELESVRQQAYIATATGEYLDRLIDGTFQLQRTPATRSVGYVVLFGDSPLTNYPDIQLRYADYDYETGEFTGGLQNSTKFMGYNVQGDEAVVFSLIRPRNDNVSDDVTRLIVLNRSVQFLLLPVASVLKGTRANIREGGIYSFPSPPPGLSGVLNTNNPGLVFFSSDQTFSDAPYFSRFTEILGYNNATSSFSVLNAYNFSQSGHVEISTNVSRDKDLAAVYSENPGGTGILRTGGLIFEYVDASTNSITLGMPIENALNQVPHLDVADGEEVKTLLLDSFTYDGVSYENQYDGTFMASPGGSTTLRAFIESQTNLLIEQRASQISSELIFDPDSVLTQDYRLIESARVSGASDEASDAEYRQSLIRYLAGLSRATNSALEAGSLQIPGISFARTLPSHLAPRGSAVILLSDDSGFLSPTLKAQARAILDREWKAAGINVIIRAPSLLLTNATMTVRLEPGTFRNSVTQQINTTIEEYLKTRLPGDTLRYSDLLEVVTDIGGVLNVFNMVLTKKLTDDTYQEHKAAYDERVLLQASSDSDIILVSEASHGYDENDLGMLLLYNSEGGTVEPEGDPTAANAILYAIPDANTLEIIVGNGVLLDDLYQILVTNPDADNVDYFQNVILAHPQMFASEEERNYFLSFILGEPFEILPPENYPIDVDNINYQYIRDYLASEVEIFRSNTITIGTNVMPLIGIRYI